MVFRFLLCMYNVQINKKYFTELTIIGKSILMYIYISISDVYIYNDINIRILYRHRYYILISSILRNFLFFYSDIGIIDFYFFRYFNTIISSYLYITNLYIEIMTINCHCNIIFVYYTLYSFYIYYKLSLIV